MAKTLSPVNQKVLLLTPPFTQLNTPYPATAYLKGFLNTKGIEAAQADLGLSVILKLFSRKGLEDVFHELENSDLEVSENSFRIYQLRRSYLQTIESVIRFLQHKDPTLANRIVSRGYLPEAGRFAQLEDLGWAFGSMGNADKARHFATLYLEDLGDLIRELIDPHFGFSRYAERLARTATHFDPLLTELHQPSTLIVKHLEECVEELIQQYVPDVVCLSAPFPGNVFGAFKIGQYLKANHPEIKIILGGGYANTELRSLRDPRVFDYLDFICLDDGEAPLLFLLEHIAGLRPQSQLKRTFIRTEKGVRLLMGAVEKDVPQREVGTPSYEGLLLDKYLSVIELVNPMHSLWSNGRWNKLTLAHGCYWGKCTFCDISLDYIGRYEPVDASLICDRIEELIAETGEHGFHFVDEAAPPALMRDMALEILRRGLTVTWWANIRFEKRFTPDLCRLLQTSGCIAVSGGLEVASDRLLDLIKKGVTVAQVATVTNAFTAAGIMVHAYLMYGFPTQTDQETIDSLEVVRQLFEAGVIQSGFWHQFAMTSHSPVGKEPAAFGVVKTGPAHGPFADNDLYHDDPEGADHETYSEGLRVSLYNFMHGVGLEEPLNQWFDFEVPETTVSPTHIEEALASYTHPSINWKKTNQVVTWLGTVPEIEPLADEPRSSELSFAFPQGEWTIHTSEQVAKWLVSQLPHLLPTAADYSLTALGTSWEEAGLGSFDELLETPFWQALNAQGLLIV